MSLVPCCFPAMCPQHFLNIKHSQSSLTSYPFSHYPDSSARGCFICGWTFHCSLSIFFYGPAFASPLLSIAMIGWPTSYLPSQSPHHCILTPIFFSSSTFLLSLVKWFECIVLHPSCPIGLTLGCCRCCSIFGGSRGDFVFLPFQICRDDWYSLDLGNIHLQM